MSAFRQSFEPKAAAESRWRRSSGAIAKAALAIAVLSAVEVAAEEKAEPNWVTTFGPNLPSFLTLASGHSYTVLQMGPVFGKEGKPLGWRIPFLSPSSDPAVILAAAKELLEVAKPDAQAMKMPAIVLSAVLSFDATTGRGTNYGVIFEKRATGWELLQPIQNVPESSPEIRKLLDGWGGFKRDSKREEAGVRAALQWLELLDAGKFDEAWEEASPLLRATISHDARESLPVRVADRGKVASRTEQSRLCAGYSINLPPATYLAVVFRAKLAGSMGPLMERIQLRLEEDGTWKVIGYGWGQQAA